LASVDKSKSVNKMLNTGNKNRRVKEDSGERAKSFKLSIFFLIIIFVSLLLSTLIYLLDLNTYSRIKEFIAIEKSVRDELLAMKSSSVTLAVSFEGHFDYLTSQDVLFRSSKAGNREAAFNIPNRTL
jgi:hypothetical protein